MIIVGKYFLEIIRMIREALEMLEEMSVVGD